MTKAHTGHLGQSGLQKHSTGELYPWTIQVVGNSCQALHCLDGRLGPKWEYTPGIAGSFVMAHAFAEEDIRDFIEGDRRKAA